MAKMHPDDIEEYESATEGEKKVFRFIREAARPHKDFTCWYEPPVGSAGKEPDFILFGKKSGLLVIEVKDWTAHQIVSYNPHQFTVRISGKDQKRTNPDRQAKGYVHTLKERLSGVPEFLSNLPKYQGCLEIPIGRMVVFPNISRAEYADSKFKWFLESGRGDVGAIATYMEVLSACLEQPGKQPSTLVRTPFWRSGRFDFGRERRASGEMDAS